MERIDPAHQRFEGDDPPLVVDDRIEERLDLAVGEGVAEQVDLASPFGERVVGDRFGLGVGVAFDPSQYVLALAGRASSDSGLAGRTERPRCAG